MTTSTYWLIAWLITGGLGLAGLYCVSSLQEGHSKRAVALLDGPDGARRAWAAGAAGDVLGDAVMACLIAVAALWADRVFSASGTAGLKRSGEAWLMSHQTGLFVAEGAFVALLALIAYAKMTVRWHFSPHVQPTPPLTWVAGKIGASALIAVIAMVVIWSSAPDLGGLAIAVMVGSRLCSLAQPAPLPLVALRAFPVIAGMALIASGSSALPMPSLLLAGAVVPALMIPIVVTSLLAFCVRGRAPLRIILARSV